MSGFPGRPDHPDFWLISEALIENDAQADQGTPFEDMVSRIVNPEVLAYIAAQRARRTMDPLVGPIAAWMDGFIAGARYQHKRQEKDNA